MLWLTLALAAEPDPGRDAYLWLVDAMPTLAELRASKLERAVLAEQLAAVGRYEDANRLIEVLLPTVSEPSEQVRWHVVRLQNAEAAGPGAQVAEAQRAVSMWEAAGRGPDQGLGDTLAAAATQAHRLAADTRRAEHRALALQLYEAWETTSGPGPLTFYRGELLYADARWNEAGDAYDAYLAASPRDSNVNEARYAAVLARYAYARSDACPQPPMGVRTELAPCRAALVAAADREGSTEALRVALSAVLAHWQLDEAERRFAELAEDAEARAIYAAALLRAGRAVRALEVVAEADRQQLVTELCGDRSRWDGEATELERLCGS